MNTTDVEWVWSGAPIPYPQAVREMEAHIAQIAAGAARERIWCLEHPPLYTYGAAAEPEELLDSRFPVYRTARGGRFTYHGPGQRVVYVMLDLRRRGLGVRAFVRALEAWIMEALRMVGLTTARRAGRIGLWVDTAEGEKKIAAIGIRIRRWVSFHGVSINLAPNLEHFSGIVPCGITEHGITSLAEFGITATMSDLDDALVEAFSQAFPSA